MDSTDPYQVTVPATTEPDSSSSTGSIPLFRIVICFVLFVVVLLTMIGNTIVLISIGIDRKLRRSKFNLFIANLALTDIMVALMAMSFYTFDILLGYWPFGEILCGIWIFFDYGMTFASVFTLVAISLDRFWSVQWSLHYRRHNSRTKTIMAIVVVWSVNHFISAF